MGFEKNFLILSGVWVNENLMYVDLNWSGFFMHIHDLPLSKMTFDIDSLIGNKIWRFRDMEMEDSSRAWDASMRIRVALNVTLPYIQAVRIYITMEVLNSLITTTEKTSELRGLAAMHCIGRILGTLESTSSMKVNLEKSSLVLSRNSPIQGRETLAETIGVRIEAKHDKYLGMAALVGRPKREVFLILKDRVWARLQNWRWEFFYHGGAFFGHLKLSLVITTPNRLPLNAAVDVLVTVGVRFGMKSWSNFRLEDTNLILNNPLVVSCPYTLQWHYKRHGYYLARSVYHLVVAVPLKVQLFTLRIDRDALPTSFRLPRCGVQMGCDCPWCGDHVEDLLHTLLQCHYPRLV
ncbi:UNVERIFIED_CONTAM: hypothetical protein Scaly_2253300 [Sesamum calycinum]|uniref:Reverse transcriptase zinc-binding domain-containing protein n=1 Tax=Sesamum calycinum TaxID=2727403 RepID=A0AAW2MAE8_9LAMI